jgi:phosphocarrier protein
MNGPPPLWLHSEFTVHATDGLHARPAIQLSRLARKYASAIQLRLAGDGDWIDAKSISKLMSLRAHGGKVIEARAAGEDAGAAIAGLGDFFESDAAEQGEDAG